MLNTVKLSEMTNDRACELMCEIVEPVLNILNDEDLISELKKTISADGEVTMAEIRRVGMVKFAVLFNIVFKNHRHDIYAILAPFYGVPVDEFARLGFIKTIKFAFDIVNDEGFKDFLSSLPV